MENQPKDVRCKIEDSTRYDLKPIEVVVGKAERKFYVHESLVRSRSKFFEKALKSEWREGQERRIQLLGDDEDVFRGYLHWVYTGNISCLDSRSEPKYLPLAKLYVFAEKLIDEELQDRTLDAIVKTSRMPRAGIGPRPMPTEEVIGFIYTNTPSSSPARRLMVDLYTVNGSSKFPISSEVGVDFLVDITKALMAERIMTEENRKRKFSELETGNPCSYHHHDKDKPCGAKTA